MAKMDRSSYFCHSPTVHAEDEAMSTEFLTADQLPRRAATQVKNSWGELTREVQAAGTIAVTSHDKVEMVVMHVTRYREITDALESARKRQEAALAELTADFDHRLAKLRAPGARQQIDAAMASHGKVSPRPKAGASY
jgi:hypothetical protein